MKGPEFKKPIIQVTLDDSKLNEFGKFIFSKISFSHPFFKETTLKFPLELKNKFLTNDIMVICSLIANAKNQIGNHNDFLIDFDIFFH